MKRNTLIGLLALILLLSLLYKGRTSFPTCTFPTTGGTCSVTLTLPENRSYDQLSLNMTFNTAPGPVTEWITVTPPPETLLDDPQDRYHNFIIHIPGTSTKTYDIEATVTTTATTNQQDTATATLLLYHINYPYPSESVTICDTYQGPTCTPQSLIDNYRGNTVNGGPITYRLPPLELLGSTPIVAAPAPSGTATLTASVPPTQTLPTLADNALLITVHLHWDGLGSPDTNPPTHAPTSVQVRYREHTSPTNIHTTLNTTTLFDLAGPQTSPLTTQNFATTANTLCGRPTNTAPCQLSLNFASTTAGSLTATENSLHKIIGTQTPTNTTACGTCSTVGNTTCGTCGGSTTNTTCTTNCGTPPTNQTNNNTTCTTNCGSPNPQTCTTQTCTAWSACVNGTQTRTCPIPTNPCPQTAAPATTQTCTEPNDWLQAIKSIPTWLYLVLGAGVVFVLFKKFGGQKRRR